MTSEGDARENESGRRGSDFGPPLEDFGSAGSDFGPPLSEFGPPMRGDSAPRWPDAEQDTDQPDLSWRPAEPETLPPPPPQYRAPDSTVFGEPPAPPPRDQYFDDDSVAETVRRSTVSGDNDNWWSSPASDGGAPTPPTEAPGLSWADDPIARRLQPKAPTSAPPKEDPSPSAKRRVIIASVAAVVVLIAVIGTVIAVSGGKDETDGSPVGGQAAAGQACPAGVDGKVTTGNGAGDTSSGAGAILGFQYGFYVERSGERAHRFVAPDAENVARGEQIQKGIDDSVPVGTTHCLRIAETTPGTFDVDLTEYQPGGQKTVYQQVVKTVDRDGKFLVFSIAPRGTP